MTLPTATLDQMRFLQAHVGGINEENGWHERANSLILAGDKEALVDHVLAKLMLVNTELSEAVEEARDGRGWDEIYYKPDSEKPEGFSIELADALIRILDTADILEIDLARAVSIKLDANAKRGYKHGGRIV